MGSKTILLTIYIMHMWLNIDDFKKLISGGVIEAPQINLRISLDDIWYQAMQDCLDKAQDESMNIDSQAVIKEEDITIDEVITMEE